MRRRAFFASLTTAFLLAACAGGLGPLTPTMDETTMGGTLIVIRHAERTGDDLNADGIARAQALADALAGVEIDGIFTPATQRNIDTARPLAEAKELEIQVIPAVDIARTMFKRQPGGTLIWVGNKDNLAALWEEIGAGGEPPVNYGEMFIVPMSGLNASGVERSTFGAAPDA